MPLKFRSFSRDRFCIGVGSTIGLSLRLRDSNFVRFAKGVISLQIEFLKVFQFSNLLDRSDGVIAQIDRYQVMQILYAI